MADSTKTDLEFQEEWDQLSFDGDVKPTDRMILRAIFANPGSTLAQLSEMTRLSVQVISRRLMKPGVIRARMMIEGTVSQQMMAAAEKYVRLVNRTLERAEQDPDVERLYELYKDQPKALEKALELVGRSYDPRLAHEMGKTAVGFLAKEAELALKNREVEVKERTTPLTPTEARQVLEADVASGPDIKVEIPDL